MAKKGDWKETVFFESTVVLSYLDSLRIPKGCSGSDVPHRDRFQLLLVSLRWITTDPGDDGHTARQLPS